MPASTRSQTKQIQLDDKQQLRTPIHTNKRKADHPTSPAPSRKAPKHEKDSSTAKHDAKSPATDDDPEVVIINRAPVLELWAASVTSFLHPKLPWQTCLSAGGAISTICAISKGRAIGSIDKPDPDKAEQKREERRIIEEDEKSKEIEVMQFHLVLKDGHALVSGKPRKPNEGALKHKFGDQKYAAVLGAFKSSLKSWNDHEQDLSHEAFHMYESFRPTVPAGQKGWGRQSRLSLSKIRETVSRSKS